MNNKLSQRVLIIEGVQGRCNAQAAALTQVGYSVESVLPGSSEQLEAQLAGSGADVVLYGRGENMPKLPDVATIFAQDSVEIPVIVLENKVTKRSISNAENDGAVAVIQNGQLDKLLRTVKKELKSVLLYRRIERLENGIGVGHKESGGGVGHKESGDGESHLQNRINELESILEENEARILSLTDDSRLAIAYIDEGTHIYANASYCKLLGHDTDEEIIGTPLMDRVDQQQHEMLTKLLRSPFDSHETRQLEVELVEEAAEPFEASLEFSAVRYANKPCTQVMIRACSELEMHKPNPGTQHDAMTGIYNRQYFMNALEENIASGDKSGKFQAVTFILLDNFKEIREEIGVTASDGLIVEIAGLVKEVYGEDHSIARFGDYTFTVINKYSYKEGAEQLAETIRSRIAKHQLTANDHTVSTTCSIGICVINDHVKDAQSAHSRADLACELARTSGGNQVHVHSTTIDAQIDQEVDEKMDDMIRKTIDEDRFYLVYQPVISLNGKAGGHYEVLLRVLDEDGCVVMPGQFLSLAEKSPMILEIDRRVIQLAMQALADNHKDGGDLSFFIKLSGEIIADPNFPEWIILQAQRFCLRSAAVIFEIPESVAVNKQSEALAFTKAVHALGFRVAIEHFGYADRPDIIECLPVDFLKIDGSLVSNLASSKDNQEKVRSIVALARRTDTQCIAEHVDDARCLVMLWKYKVDYIQGNLIQEPGKELTHAFEDEAALAGIFESDKT